MLEVVLGATFCFMLIRAHPQIQSRFQPFIGAFLRLLVDIPLRLAMKTEWRVLTASKGCLTGQALLYTGSDLNTTSTY